jgi:hypothetical protein
MRQNSESEWNYKWVLEQAPIKTAFLVIFVLKSELLPAPPPRLIKTPGIHILTAGISGGSAMTGKFCSLNGRLIPSARAAAGEALLQEYG